MLYTNILTSNTLPETFYEQILYNITGVVAISILSIHIYISRVSTVYHSYYHMFVIVDQSQYQTVFQKWWFSNFIKYVFKND